MIKIQVLFIRRTSIDILMLVLERDKLRFLCHCKFGKIDAQN
jgi:hypothetical protein